MGTPNIYIYIFLYLILSFPSYMMCFIAAPFTLQPVYPCSHLSLVASSNTCRSGKQGMDQTGHHGWFHLHHVRSESQIVLSKDWGDMMDVISRHGKPFQFNSMQECIQCCFHAVCTIINFYLHASNPCDAE